MPQNPTGASVRTLPAALVLIALGLPGVLSLLPTLPAVPGAPRLAFLIDPLILLGLAAFLGVWIAPRCGFRSRIAGRVSGGSIRMLPPAAGRLLAIGIALGGVITLADHALSPFWQERPSFPPSLVEAWSLPAFVIGILYGGIVEEILMRWGLMSLFVWILWRICANRAEKPPEAAVLTGLIAAALVFAASHLPALIAGGAEMTTALVIRTLGFNMMLGLLFGWLFARRDLESAMLAHAGFHAGVLFAALPARLLL